MTLDITITQERGLEYPLKADTVVAHYAIHPEPDGAQLDVAGPDGGDPLDAYYVDTARKAICMKQELPGGAPLFRLRAIDKAGGGQGVSRVVDLRVGSDVHDLGWFPSVYAVMKRYPEGGLPGDYVTILGVKHFWDVNRKSWGILKDKEDNLSRMVEDFIRFFSSLGCLYRGVAVPNLVPPAVGRVFYLAFEAGTYKYFDGLAVEPMEAALLARTRQGWEKVGLGSLGGQYPTTLLARFDGLLDADGQPVTDEDRAEIESIRHALGKDRLAIYHVASPTGATLEGALDACFDETGQRFATAFTTPEGTYRLWADLSEGGTWHATLTGRTGGGTRFVAADLEGRDALPNLLPGDEVYVDAERTAYVLLDDDGQGGRTWDDLREAYNLAPYFYDGGTLRPTMARAEFDTLAACVAKARSYYLGTPASHIPLHLGLEGEGDAARVEASWTTTTLTADGIRLCAHRLSVAANDLSIQSASECILFKTHGEGSTFLADDGHYKEIAGQSYLEVTPASIEIGPEGGTRTLTLSTGGAWGIQTTD